MKRLFWAIGILILGVNPTASAQEISPADLFALLDQNRDGKLVTDEIPEGQYRFFERILRLGDKNRDGSISLEEFAVALKGDPLEASEPLASPTVEKAPTTSDAPSRGPEQKLHLDEILKRFDKNDDGKISREELPESARERLAPVFDRLGRDAISLEELRAQAQREFPHRDEDEPSINGNWMERDRTAEGTHIEGDRTQFLRRPFALIRLLDQDGNGTLNAAEWAQAVQVFKQLDTNADGELSQWELIGIPLPSREIPAKERGDFPAGQRPDDGDLPRRESIRGASSGEAMSVPRELFRRIDSNGDGWITSAEAPQRLRDSFSQIDTDNDGRLTLDEFCEGLLMLRQRRQPE